MKLMDSDYFYPINLGNDQEISIIELANLIKSKIDNKLSFEFCDLPFDDPKFRKPSLDKLTKIFDWYPELNYQRV